ncbi:MAG: hypothetical protein ABJQ26_00260, partial [Maricaulis sp.]
MTHTAPILDAERKPLPGRKPGRCAHVFDGLPEAVRSQIAPAQAFLDTVFDAAPYLARLAQRRPATLAACAVEPPE